MKYKVLYRKYRPNDFENIIGQEYIIKTLKNSIKNNNVSHAYIFSGPRGTGKTTTAKVFSKAINCLNNTDGSPCGKCEFCLNFQDNPDIIEIDAASNNGVDEIRNIIENVKLTPTNGKYKIYIIDEVHMLSTSAFNALLLTLEEPPSHSIFILATTNVENVPITIQSRCQRFDFQKIKVNDIVERLKYICEQENIDAEEEALKEIAYLSEGGMRDALSILDQVSKNAEKITLELIESQIKTISKVNIVSLLDLIENNDIENCLKMIDEYRTRGVDYKILVKKIIDIASNRAKNIKITGKYDRLNYDDYKKLILSLVDSINKININVDAYTILEMILLEYTDAPISEKNDIKEAEKSPKIEEKENKKSKENATDSLDKNLINIRINNCFVNAQKKYLEEAKKIIEECVLSTDNGKVKSILSDSSVVAASDTNLIFTCSNSHNVDNANKDVIMIENLLSKKFNRNYKIVFIDNEKWNQEKNVYIENLKNKKKYEYIEEPKVEKNIDLVDIFDKDKIEII